MTNKTGILSLGTRADATTWEKGCKGLGFDAPLPLKKPGPTLDELTGFWAGSYDWLFLAGHFAGRRLYNESGGVGVRFAATGITLEAGKESATVAAKDLTMRPKLILWGGCSTLGNNQLVRDLRTLFGAHTMIGFRDITGWKMVDAALGGGFLKDKKHFFTRVTAGSTSTELTDAWMQTALLGWKGSTVENRFAAVDDTGQRWILKDGKIHKDSKLT